ncbi:AMP-binding protein [Mycolicibacterium sp.]|uniref:AMP-binding protein n=1 Tax=Mycolicibacterium sp. TaxID=2320850 RepID=UPI003D0CB45B
MSHNGESGDIRHGARGDGVVPYGDDDVRRYRALGLWNRTSLPAEIDAALAGHGDRPAVVTHTARWSYRELRDQVRTFASGVLAATALRPGDAVMFQMGNVEDTVVSYLGALTAGLRPVCTLPQHGAREVGLLARHIGAAGLFTQTDFGKGQLPDIARALLADGTVTSVVEARGHAVDGATGYDAVMAAGRDAGWGPVAAEHNGIALFQLSGGTTGLPKVAPRQHEEYVYNAKAWAHALGWGPDTVALYPLPLMHNAGIALALQPVLFAGGTLVLAPSADTHTLLDLIEAERPTTLPLVPPALAIRLLEEPRTRTVDLSTIRDFIVGGQRLAVEVAARLHRELGIAVRQMFGMAEGMFTLTPADAGEYARYHTVGQPICALDEIRIVDPATNEEILDDTVGELCVRGPYTIRGYYRAPEHNQRAFTADGFYRTGDLCRRHVIDGQTMYSIDGRIKDVINRGVEKIHAEEIEELILTHPGVANAALVAMPDAVLGERACAYLIMEPGATALTVATLAEHLSARGVAKYKLPERVEIRERFPLSNVGKVSKKALREDIEATLRCEQRAAVQPARTGAPQ